MASSPTPALRPLMRRPPTSSGTASVVALDSRQRGPTACRSRRKRRYDQRRGWNAVIPGHSTKDSHEDAPLFLPTTDKKNIVHLKSRKISWTSLDASGVTRKGQMTSVLTIDKPLGNRYLQIRLFLVWVKESFRGQERFRKSE